MEHSFRKGEKLGKWQPSGLILASNFPILRLYNHPFNQWECVGFDCLPNKGVLAVMLDVPGVPEAVAYATMHYNSRGASGVNPERALIAHNLQVDETNEFPAGLDKPGIPFIWAGDLNMRHADDRIKFFVERFNGKLNEVSSFCVKKPGRCKIVMRWDTDTPWYETQDLQGWLSGNRVKVQPIRVEQLFDEPVDGIMPSDHNALLVTYRLIWSLETIGS